MVSYSDSIRYMMSYVEVPRLKMPREDIGISDTTLRDGLQMPGVTMTMNQQLRVYDYLYHIGIDKLECFMSDKFYRDIVYAMLNKGYEKPEVTGWARADRKDIDDVHSIGGIKEVGMLMSVSDPHIYDKMGITRKEAEKKYLDALRYALDKGLRVRCHLEDITRSDFDGFVLPFVNKIIEEDPDAIIRICDTVGYGLPFPDEDLEYEDYDGPRPPFSIPTIVRKLLGIGVKNVEMHAHDDYGFAPANTLAAVKYGANWVSVTFLGIGERSGNSELEKFLAFVNTRTAHKNKYKTDCLKEFADYVNKERIVYVPKNKAVVGDNVFAVKSGIHGSAILKNPFTYEPYEPKIVGQERKFLIGMTSGSGILVSEINKILEKKGYPTIKKEDPLVASTLEMIKDLYRDGKGRMSDVADWELEKMIETQIKSAA